MVGVLALVVAAGAVVVTGMFLTGKIKAAAQPATAVFGNCGQGLHEGGDVKTRGVLIGRIETITRLENGDCEIELSLFPASVEQIPSNVAAQVRAKTIFGEKWVELLYPQDPAEDSIEPGAVISETIDPLEIETILNVALPILDAIDPEHLAGALEALATGFVGHEDAAIRGIESGTEAVAVANDNRALFEKGLNQLAESSEVFNEVDEDLLEALEDLDRLGRFTSQNSDLVAENLRRTPILLRELSELFETRFFDLTRIVDRGATVIGILAARTDDLERLLTELPKFNSNWIRNLSHQCRYRQAPSEPGKNVGDPIPGRCWRVHNILSSSQGAYAPGQGPGPNQSSAADFEALGIANPSSLDRILFAPAAGAER